MQRARDDNSQDRVLFEPFIALDYQIVLIFFDSGMGFLHGLPQILFWSPD